MLDNFEIRDKIARDKYFEMTGYVHSHHQKEADKGYGKIVESDTYVSVYSKKKIGWSGLKTNFYGSKQMTK